MLQPGQPAWVAVSGGVDSMVLLHVLRRLGHPVRVAHVDHGLRGAQSDADRAFVELYARNEGLEVRWIRVDPKAAAEGISVQMAARELRYGWFRNLLAEGPHAIALGHHRDDAVETFLLHLLRGIGVKGWNGLPPVTVLDEGRVCRPLIGVGRAEILAYAAEHGIAFREDASNTDPKYLRNRIRHELMPLLEELRPGAAQTWGRATDLLRGMGRVAEAQLAREAAAVKPGPDGSWTFPLSDLEAASAPRILLMHLIQGLQPHPDLVDRLLEAVADRATGAHFHCGGWRIALGRDAIHVDRAPDGFPIFRIPGPPVEAGQAGPFGWSVASPGEVDLTLGMHTAWLDMDRLEDPLVLRPWEHGDRMRPIGLGGSKLVSDILTDAGTPLPAKENTYVLTSGGRVIWLVGHRVAEGYAPGKTTSKVLRLTSGV